MAPHPPLRGTFSPAAGRRISIESPRPAGAGGGGPKAGRGALVAPRGAKTWEALITVWLVRVFLAVVLSLPFYWMLITTFKRTTDLYNLKNNPFVFNEPPTMEHLRLLFHETLFMRWVLNTTFAGAIVVIITLVLAVPAAYALARLTGG